MASVYRRQDSPYWYIRYKSPQGAWMAKKTLYLAASTLHRAKAMEEAARLSVSERSRQLQGNDSWVLPHIEGLPRDEKTICHYRNSWRWLSRFLSERNMALVDFTPQLAEDYLAWRKAFVKVSGKKVGHNQACRDIKILKWIHRQGRLLGRLETRAMDDYRIRYESQKRVKPVFTDEQIQRIRNAVRMDAVPRWMAISFEIAFATGCRLRETSIPLSSVDLNDNTITFPCPKGGTGRAYTIPIPSTLRPLLAEMKAQGLSHTCHLPGSKTSHYWRKFLDILGMPDHCFHSLRVTRVTDLRRAGVPQSVAMRLVNHSSTLVHEMYQRHEVEDLRGWVDAGKMTTRAAAL